FFSGRVVAPRTIYRAGPVSVGSAWRLPSGTPDSLSTKHSYFSLSRSPASLSPHRGEHRRGVPAGACSASRPSPTTTLRCARRLHAGRYLLQRADAADAVEVGFGAGDDDVGVRAAAGGDVLPQLEP